MFQILQGRKKEVFLTNFGLNVTVTNKLTENLLHLLSYCKMKKFVSSCFKIYFIRAKMFRDQRGKIT